MKERTKLFLVAAVFLGAYFLPIESARVQRALPEGFVLLRDYAREHVLLCLVPAFFIAGAIGQFVSQGAVMKYLGSTAKRPVAYGVASVSGGILAVCSCTVLPLFGSIYRRGAGLGPASAFLYSGPAINILAMILTARILGLELGVARIVGAVVFAVVIGLLMAAIFRRQEAARATTGPDPFAAAGATASGRTRAGWQDAAFLGSMVAFLVFANWGAPNREVGFFAAVWAIHWVLAGAALLLTFGMMWRWYDRDELHAWVLGSWEFAKQILPLLLGGAAAFGATALGAIPGIALKGIDQRFEDSMLGLAAGMMLAASSFSLILPGLEAAEALTGSSSLGAGTVVMGMALGVLLMLGLDQFTPHEHAYGGPCGAGYERIGRLWLFVFAIALHNLPEGMAIGVSFSQGDLGVGLPLTTAIALQDLLEGLAVAMALRAIGLSPWHAFLLAAATGLMEPLGALLGYVAVVTKHEILLLFIGGTSPLPPRLVAADRPLQLRSSRTTPSHGLPPSPLPAARAPAGSPHRDVRQNSGTSG